MPRPLKCDFCSAPKVEWAFLQSSASVIGVDEKGVHIDDGCWAACDGCRQLIESKDRQRLLDKSYDALFYVHPELLVAAPCQKKKLKQAIKTLHDGFFDLKLDRPPIRVVR